MREVLAFVREYLSSVRLVLHESFKSFMKNGGLDRSAALTFYAFLSLVPLLLAEVFLVASLIHSSDRALDLLETTTQSLIPEYGHFVMDEVAKLSLARSWGIISIIVLIWSATPLASGLRNACYSIFRPEKAFSFLKGLTFDIIAVVAALTLMATSLILKVAYTAGTNLLSPAMRDLAQMAYGGLLFLGLPLFLLLFYRLFVPVRLKFRHLLAGCVITAVLLSIVGPFFTFVLKYNPNMGVAFVSLKAMFLLLLWVYYSFAMVLLGTEIMANLARHEALIIGKLFAQSTLKPSAQRLLNRFVRELEPGEVLFREGDSGTNLYYVLDGEIELSRGTEKFRVMKAGEYFGEMAMLLNAARTMSASAGQSGARLVAVSRENMDTVLKENPKIVVNILKEMAARLHSTDENIRSDRNAGSDVDKM